MALFRKSPESRVEKALGVMNAEYYADEREERGMMNRPRYVTAKESIRKLGKDATQPLLRHLERLEDAEAGSSKKFLADDIVQLLGDSRDPSAVPELESLLPGIWPSLPTALAKTEEGTQVLLKAARSPDERLRARAMGVWSSNYRPAEVIEALEAGLRDADTYVRGEALSCVIARGRAEQPLITALLDMRSSDPQEKLRDRADSALRRLGVI